MDKESADAAEWLDTVTWDSQGLVPAIAQNEAGRLLMMAWMDREALQMTAATGTAHYWSRSRKRLWRKGESSGHVQYVTEIRLDCDNDVILLTVRQQGDIACHTGRETCFYQRLVNGRWVITEPVRKAPELIYGPGNNLEPTAKYE